MEFLTVKKSIFALQNFGLGSGNTALDKAAFERQNLPDSEWDLGGRRGGRRSSAGDAHVVAMSGKKEIALLCVC